MCQGHGSLPSIRETRILSLLECPHSLLYEILLHLEVLESSMVDGMLQAAAVQCMCFHRSLLHARGVLVLHRNGGGRLASQLPMNRASVQESDEILAGRMLYR